MTKDELCNQLLVVSQSSTLDGQCCMIPTTLLREAICALRAPEAADAALGFCEWLKGYFSGVVGRDELIAFEANTIRAELTERVFPVAPPTPQPDWKQDQAETTRIKPTPQP